ncbi:MAG: 50S ribosomal protein L13 [Candidatus Schekmanbacteria bacterium]|nr:50S ribosomal protein L13 [Candidatus Schekmanbacteria bacterium]
MKMTTHVGPTDMKETWYLLDAEGKTLGRLSSQIALLLRGKHLPSYTPSSSPKTHCIVVNAGKVVLTGDKLHGKLYHRFTGYPGGIRTRTAGEIFATKPTQLFRLSVQRMLPKNSLGRALLKNLVVYAGPEHPHQAQKPSPLALTENGELKYPFGA